MPPPHHLTGAQLRELESELRRDLVALERRLINERVDDTDEMSQLAIHDFTAANRRTSDIVVRREAVTDALARISTGAYGTCMRCTAPIRFGRLVAMPEVTHCLSCHWTP